MTTSCEIFIQPISKPQFGRRSEVWNLVAITTCPVLFFICLTLIVNNQIPIPSVPLSSKSFSYVSFLVSRKKHRHNIIYHSMHLSWLEWFYFISFFLVKSRM